MKPQIVDREVTLHILKTFHLHADKKMGQNFLISPSTLQTIVDAADVGASDTVLEVGPGIGTLTQGLAETGCQVVAVELDRRLLSVLDKTLEGYENVRVVHGDILKLDLVKTVGASRFQLVANLPYYITTPIILKMLEEHLPVDRLVTMVQLEVAKRMVAKPGGKDYGALSVAVQYYSEPKIVAEVPPNSFYPAPTVTSAVIRCDVRRQPPVDITDEGLFFRIVKAAFGQRRKMLTNALRATGATDIPAWLEKAGIDGNRRGETLSLQEFAVLTNSFQT